MYYQVTDYYDLISQQRIPDKCPDCGHENCLELRFYQKRTETPFSKKVSKKVSGILYCHQTKTEISPVLWTDAIEHRFNTEKAKLKLHPTGLKFSKWFYGLLILIPLLLISFIGFFQWENQQYINTSAAINNAKVGDKVKVMQTFMTKGKVTSNGNTWYQIKGIDGDTLFLTQHRDFKNDESFDFDLNDTNFTGETIKASLPRFKERSVIGFDYTNLQFSGYITEIKTQQ